jgi:glutaconate CoA-transferase subunit A
VTKQRSIEEAAALVPDGCTVAIGGLSMNMAPMALVRELVRQRKRDLTVVAIVAGMSVDWLVAGGCARRVVSGLVSFEGLGLAPSFRAAVESGAVEMEEYSEQILIARLQAEAHKLPFMPTRCGLGTDLLALHPDSISEQLDPATMQRYVACRPLPVDVALVHAHAADDLGNVRVDPKLIWMDNEIVNAASTTIASVERIVDHQAFVDEPHRTTYPRLVINAVAEAPYGAYPTSCFPSYGQSTDFYTDYAAAATDAPEFEKFFLRRIVEPDSWESFLDANGGASALLALRRRVR